MATARQKAAARKNGRKAKGRHFRAGTRKVSRKSHR